MLRELHATEIQSVSGANALVAVIAFSEFVHNVVYPIVGVIVVGSAVVHGYQYFTAPYKEFISNNSISK